jgi:hypothetical protein
LLGYNLGMEYEVTPTVELNANATYLQFASTDVIQYVEHDSTLQGRDIGIDYSLGVRYRPLLNNNIIVNAGLDFLTPFSAFQEIYNSETLYSTFVSVTFTY